MLRIQGFKREGRCESLLADLKKQFEKRISEIVEKNNQVGKKKQRRVTIKDERLKTSRTSDGGVAGQLGALMPGMLKAPPDHQWIESMSKFRRALMELHENLPNNQKPERVKVSVTRKKLELDCPQLTRLYM